jgi:hypothetical protein
MKKLTLIAFIAIYGLLSTYTVSEAQFINVVLSLTGNVLDKTTHQPISMRLEAFDSKGNRIYYGRTKAENNGYYFITGLKPGMEYTLKFSDNEKYATTKELVKLPKSDSYQEIKRDFQIETKEEVPTPGN